MGNLRRLPYGANYLSWDDMNELKNAIDDRILFRYQTTLTSQSDQLEATVAALFGARHVLAVHNCTEALRLSLIGTEPSVGDVVYIPSVAFVAVAGAVLACGLIPEVIDVDDRLCIRADLIPPGAKRVIVVHMDGIVNPLPTEVPFVIEDVAQALGGTHIDGRFAGIAGYAGAFSFHHNKILTSGEGGLLTTNDTSRWRLMRQYHDHGCTRVHGEYPRWEENAFYGENLVTSEPIASIQRQQFRHLTSIHSGLETGYSLLIEQLNQGSQFRPIHRRPGDAKVSVHVEFESAQLRSHAEIVLRQASMPFWTLDRYFLPAHPILTKRRSIYADDFPWNLAKSPTVNVDDYAETRDRLSRRLCLSVSPEVGPKEQERLACNFRKLLEQV